MKVLLSRWQFGVTITYHFLFVPLTIGLGLLVAIMQVQAYRTRDETWDRLTRFFGTLFVINFAMGIVTGVGGPRQRMMAVTAARDPLGGGRDPVPPPAVRAGHHVIGHARPPGPGQEGFS